ncbi:MULTISPECIES: regulatory protein RecX [unclassified Gilliamella]|uniref:regulatory protein RecX n=1 Tax=unclassified Gilliamella TaxID=2685620 RepID=UPI001C6A370C|nr:regulatory protein RecX [Gilliamella sp. ESL0441]QYN45053.1 regulatory protein RecX [Gilliamella sp. ESL0441]
MNKKLNKPILNKAVQLLAQRDHSSYELTQKITLYFANKLKKTDDDYHEQLNQIKSDINNVIDYCTTQNWINDIQYIEKYIIMRANKGYGKYRIALELKQRGLPTHLSQDLLYQCDIDWSDLAYKQLIKKFKIIDPKNKLQWHKNVQFLITRGYTQDDVKNMYGLLT